MYLFKFTPAKMSRSLSARRAWIEIEGYDILYYYFLWSLSARRAWIEIVFMLIWNNSPTVALRKESVDRNIKSYVISVMICTVALRKESVDRNYIACLSCIDSVVALRKESVDRNMAFCMDCQKSTCRSPQGERG